VGGVPAQDLGGGGQGPVQLLAGVLPLVVEGAGPGEMEPRLQGLGAEAGRIQDLGPVQGREPPGEGQGGVLAVLPVLLHGQPPGAGFGEAQVGVAGGHGLGGLEAGHCGLQ